MPELLTEIYDEWCEETGVTILYDAALVGAVADVGNITACVVHTVEGLGKIQAKTFIDATGDALLSRFAGVPTAKGSETNGRNQRSTSSYDTTKCRKSCVIRDFQGYVDTFDWDLSSRIFLFGGRFCIPF